MECSPCLGWDNCDRLTATEGWLVTIIDDLSTMLVSHGLETDGLVDDDITEVNCVAVLVEVMVDDDDEDHRNPVM